MWQGRAEWACGEAFSGGWAEGRPHGPGQFAQDGGFSFDAQTEHGRAQGLASHLVVAPYVAPAASLRLSAFCAWGDNLGRLGEGAQLRAVVSVVPGGEAEAGEAQQTSDAAGDGDGSGSSFARHAWDGQALGFALAAGWAAPRVSVELFSGEEGAAAEGGEEEAFVPKKTLDAEKLFFYWAPATAQPAAAVPAASVTAASVTAARVTAARD